jgi:membrane protease YdiL (CAAX protease family)
MENGRQAINSRKIIIFLAIVFTCAMIVGSLPVLLGLKWAGTTAVVFGTIYMAFPGLAAVFVKKALYHEPVIMPLQVSFRINKWFFVGWFLPLFMALAAFVIALVIPGVSYSPDMAGMFERYKDVLTAEQLAQMKASLEQLPVHPFFLTIGQGLMAGLTINALFAFGEELGWRGFLLQELKPLGFARASILIGFIWGLWHAPLILQGHNYPQHPVTGVFMMILWCILLTPLLNYITLRAKSVVAAAIMHGSVNGLAGIAIILLSGGSDLTIGLTGLAGLIALAVFDLLLYFKIKRSKEALWPASLC